ncbi:MAG: DNA-directed DNA polymerase II small subunit [Methanobacteriota archaeon]
MNEELFHFLSERGTLLEPDAAEYLARISSPLEFLRARLATRSEWPLVLTLRELSDEGVARGGVLVPAPPALVYPNASEIRPSVRIPMPVAPSPARPQPSPVAAADAPLEILEDVTGNSRCSGEIGDFTRYFNDRYRRLAKLLKARRELYGAVPIDKVSRDRNEVRLIGIVTEVRSTHSGHRILELEDDTGTAPILAPKSDHRVLEIAETIVQDEIVGVVCKPSRQGDLLILQELVRPDIALEREPNRSKEPGLVAFISDTHFGSDTFLANEWDHFVAWLNGEGRTATERDLAERVKYVILNGDVVDGIGIYPGQAKALAIEDIFEQYRFAGEELARLPSRVKLVVIPGNHDAVRLAEPQPAFPERLRERFPKDTIFAGNPCYISLNGVEVLAYHGKSMDDWTQALPGMAYQEPIKMMVEMMRRRHLAAVYGGRTPIAPEHHDYLMIDRVPDIFATGHVHASGMRRYRGVHLLNSSCFQGQTDYQKMLGFVPVPAKVPVIDLQSGEAWLLDFKDR